MSDKRPEIEDLTQERARDHTLDVKLSAEDRARLQSEADERGVTLEDYVLCKLLTAAAVVNAGGSSSSGGGVA